MFRQSRNQVRIRTLILAIVLVVTIPITVIADEKESGTVVYLPMVMGTGVNSQVAHAPAEYVDDAQTTSPMNRNSQQGDDAEVSILLPLVMNDKTGTGKFTDDAGATDSVDTGIPDGYKVIEGDIIVPVHFGHGNTVNAAAVWDTNLWPNGIVPFEFNANIAAISRTLTINAMVLWENAADVDFQQCTSNRCSGNQANYLHIQHANENSSMVGMVGGRQVLNMFNWNWQFIIAHELAHTLGMWHEQTRPDRDDYVTINESNITNGNAGNFAIHEAADVYPKPEYGLPGDQTYDFDSVMHYGQYAFSTCRPGGSCTAVTTIDVHSEFASTWQSQIGQRNHLSDLDQLTMSFLYPEDNWQFVDQTHSGTEDGSFTKPHASFQQGWTQTAAGNVLQIQPGTYTAGGIYTKAMTLRAPLGKVTLQ